MIIILGFDVLEEYMRDDDDPIGILVVSGTNTSLFLVNNNNISRLFSMDVNLPNKQRKGGQSQVRFERLGNEARHNYITKVIEKVSQYNIPLLVGGPANLKDKFVERYNNKILKVVTTQYNEKQGAYEVLHNCLDILSNLKIKEEKEYIDRFFELLVVDDRMVVYGEEQVNQMLDMGMIDTLLINKEYTTDDIKSRCEYYKTKIIELSCILPESNQIKQGFGGRVGILRYKNNIDI